MSDRTVNHPEPARTGQEWQEILDRLAWVEAELEKRESARTNPEPEPVRIHQARHEALDRLAWVEAQVQAYLEEGSQRGCDHPSTLEAPHVPEGAFYGPGAYPSATSG
jgi:hypothetical protein